MSWRDKKEQASFRGVPFFVDKDSQPAGPRTQVHEYPQRDKPSVERLGKQTIEIKVTGFVVGDDCLDQRDKLLEAIEKPEVGELVHPWRGKISVSVIKCEYSHSRTEMGVVRFDMVFVEDDGDVPYPATSTNLASSLNAAADEVELSAIDRFAAALEGMDLSQLRLDAVLQPLGSVIDVVHSAYSTVTGVVADAQAMVAAIINGPRQFASTVLASLNGSFQSFMGFYQRGAGLISLFGISQKTDAIGRLDSTIIPAGKNQGTFVRAVKQLMQDAIVVDVIRNVAALPAAAQPAPRLGALAVDAVPQSFSVSLDNSGDIASGLLGQTEQQVPVSSDVLNARVSLTEALWGISEQSGPGHYQALAQARVLVGRHLLNVARQGVRLVTVPNQLPQPALVMAFRRYGDATRAGEIVARNRVKHPGFLPPEDLQVLKD